MCVCVCVCVCLYRYSVYVLHWYESTNTDAKDAGRTSIDSVMCTVLAIMLFEHAPRRSMLDRLAEYFSPVFFPTHHSQFVRHRSTDRKGEYHQDAPLHRKRASLHRIRMTTRASGVTTTSFVLFATCETQCGQSY